MNASSSGAQFTRSLNEEFSSAFFASVFACRNGGQSVLCRPSHHPSPRPIPAHAQERPCPNAPPTRPLSAGPMAALRPRTRAGYGTTSWARCLRAWMPSGSTPPIRATTTTSKARVDQFIGSDGSIPTWKPEEYQLDNILLGRQLLLLYGVTQDRALRQGRQAALRATAASAAHTLRRLLAQAEIPQSDVARWPLHGRAILCRVCFHLPSS